MTRAAPSLLHGMGGRVLRFIALEKTGYAIYHRNIETRALTFVGDAGLDLFATDQQALVHAHPVLLQTEPGFAGLDPAVYLLDQEPETILNLEEGSYLATVSDELDTHEKVRLQELLRLCTAILQHAGTPPDPGHVQLLEACTSKTVPYEGDAEPVMQAWLHLKKQLLNCTRLLD